MRILYVEDDATVAEFVRSGLAAEGFTIDIVGSASAAHSALATNPYSAVVLDLNLPDADGLSILGSLRAARRGVPVLILSTRNQIDSRIQGLDAGADDYLAKPFAVGELAARLRALLRRPRKVVAKVISVGNIALDPDSGEVRISGQSISLPPKERRLLELLLTEPNEVLSKSDIEKGLYGPEVEIASNAVEVHIHHLRRRMERAGANLRIATRRGQGYRLEP
ncbi:MAG: response regulator transcription factor [Alphaproteobacteria bacterium]|nr:response regulator transcription factor [Alphaproteobacteria bacterium]